MKNTSSRLAFVAATAALWFASVGPAVQAASGPQIAPSSCGGAPVPLSGNAYCSFEGTGQGVVIGHHSCNVEGACLTLGDGVRIGNRSCNAEGACVELGAMYGEAGTAVSIVGNSSCNGLSNCYGAGAVEGFSVIGNDSCNGGDSACYGAGLEAGTSRIGNHACNNTGIGADHNTCLFIGAGEGGDSAVGNDSCNGSSACTFGGQFGGTSTIGNNSCNGLGACFDVGQDFPPDPAATGSVSEIGNGSCNAEGACQFTGGFGGHSRIGNASCNNLYACEFSGSEGGVTSVIGNRSCNGASDLSDPDFPVGICDSNDGVIGNNKYNTP
jgi:hypothetical protein